MFLRGMSNVLAEDKRHPGPGPGTPRVVAAADRAGHRGPPGDGQQLPEGRGCGGAGPWPRVLDGQGADRHHHRGCADSVFGIFAALAEVERERRLFARASEDTAHGRPRALPGCTRQAPGLPGVAAPRVGQTGVPPRSRPRGNHS